MIDKPTFAHKAFVTVVACAALFITTMFFYGIVSLTIIGPERNATISELTTERNVWQARAKELDQYIEIREGQYRVACKFDKLFMLVASPSQVLDFEALEEYIKSKKEFFKPVKMKKRMIKKGE